MKPHVLFLDDSADRHARFRSIVDFRATIDRVETAKLAIELLRRRNYERVFLDHDLVPSHYGAPLAQTLELDNTGLAVVRAIVRENLNPAATYYVHTLNTAASNVMVRMLAESGRDVLQTPFTIIHTLRWPTNPEPHP